MTRLATPVRAGTGASLRAELSPDDGATAYWTDLLRSYSEVLEAQRALLLAVDLDDPLDADQLEVPAFVPPADAPVLPERLRHWAQALLTQTRGLAELAADVLDRHPRPLARTGRDHGPAGASGVGLDRQL